jgi:hypothetical protein
MIHFRPTSEYVFIERVSIYILPGAAKSVAKSESSGITGVLIQKAVHKEPVRIASLFPRYPRRESEQYRYLMKTRVISNRLILMILAKFGIKK